MVRVHLISILISLGGCKSGLSVMFTPGVKPAEASAEVFSLNRMTAQPGDVVKVSGVNLTSGMFVQIGNETVPLFLTGTSSGYFVMPEAKDQSTLSATFLTSDNKSFASLALLSNSSASRIPVMDADPSLICGDISYQDSTGHLKVGLRNCAATYPVCSGDGEISCVTSKTFPSVNVNTVKSRAADIRAGATIAGVNGVLPDCTLDNDVKCVALEGHPSIVKANLSPSDLKNGVTVAGITGKYPSALYPLMSADILADLDSSSFNTQIKSSTGFAWYDRTGTRHLGAGSADITATNVKSGVTLFGTLGAFSPPCTGDNQTACLTTPIYKSVDTSALSIWDIRRGKTAGGIAGALTFNRNLADLNRFNQLTGVESSTDGTFSDIYDTIDDYNANVNVFPYNVPPGFQPFNTAIWTRDASSDTGAGGGTAANGLCDGTEECIYTDNNAGMQWTANIFGYPNWQDSLNGCSNLVYGGKSDWRLPTSKELSQAYIDGIWSIRVQMNLMHTQMWSSTTISELLDRAWTVDLGNGTVEHQWKLDGYYIMCTRDK